MNEKIRLSNQQTDEMDKKYSQSNSLMAKTMKHLGEVLSANSNIYGNVANPPPNENAPIFRNSKINCKYNI